MNASLVYSFFLRYAESAAQHFSIDVRSILVELGRRRMVGDQEGMIVDAALDLVRARDRITTDVDASGHARSA